MLSALRVLESILEPDQAHWSYSLQSSDTELQICDLTTQHFLSLSLTLPTSKTGNETYILPAHKDSKSQGTATRWGDQRSRTGAEVWRDPRDPRHGAPHTDPSLCRARLPVLLGEDRVRQLRPGHGHHLAPKLAHQGLEAGVASVPREQGEEGAGTRSWKIRG